MTRQKEKNMNSVKLQIENESDLYNSFDPDEITFTEEVRSYILRQLDKADVDREISFQVLCSRPVSEEKLKKAVDAWIREAKEDLHEKNRENMIHQLWMFGIGVLFLYLSIVLQEKVSVVWFTVLSTIGSLAIWEAASIWIIENPKSLKEKKNIEKLEKNVKISVISGK